ncbi:unnamed protein product [Adineta steineri]|uniref:NAD-dependent epimerase/dehydratase domain-containing protein n=1 Tax=Adineta steineri TaxID=433720 RepID=A0A815EQ06_9BILA|nr:unnamed protein product [Adineta steineri]CAF1315031.1 unnamed protein product [Adineta steineri]
MSSTTNNPSRLVLITGAGGKIGSYFAAHANKVHPSHQPKNIELLEPHGEVVEAELEDVKALEQVCKGVHTVLHLAAQTSAEATWDQLYAPNIHGVYNIFLAAKRASVKRVIFASSLRAVCGNPKGTQAKTHEFPNPGDLYGVTKCFGEALARYMGEQEGVSAIAVRVGSFKPHFAAQDESKHGAMMDAWLSERDACQLFERCIDAPETIRFAIVHGLSNNTFNCMDIQSTKDLLGYKPQDNFFEEAEKFRSLKISQNILGHNVQDPKQKSALPDNASDPGERK